MAASQQDEKQHAEREKSTHQHVQTLIGEQVIHLLGQPGDLHRIQVRRLWDDRYRVNIFVGDDAGCATVAHSFFLTTDGAGNIVASSPNITKRY